MTQSGKMILDGVTFLLDDCDETGFYIFDSIEQEGTITVGFDVSFLKATYRGEAVGPSICVNPHETGQTGVKETEGRVFSVENMEEADEREDTFYLFEHEPMERYSFQIVEVTEDAVHVKIEGTAVLDGYADPYETASFIGDFWLDHKTS